MGNQWVIRGHQWSSEGSPNHLLVAWGQGRAGADGVTSAHLWGRGRGAVVSTCMLEPVPMASRALTSRSSVVISGHQRSSVVIRGHQWSRALTSRSQSEAIRGNQRQSEAIRGAHLALACSASFEAVEHEHVPAMHSDALRCTQMHSEALRGTQRHSEARFVALACTIRCHQQGSSAGVIIRGHQMSSALISASDWSTSSALISAAPRT